MPLSNKKAGEISAGNRLLCLLLGGKTTVEDPESIFYGRITGEDLKRDTALVLKEVNEDVFQRVGTYVDYLRKRCFQNTMEVTRVGVI